MSSNHFFWALSVIPFVACSTGAGQSAPVRPGIEVLLTDSLHLVSGKRIGILTNHAGVDRFGVGDVERILESRLNLTAIFSPEHGFRGVLDREGIGHSVDSATGLPIYSLYGEVRQPTPEMLESVDVLLVDLPDIGGRTFTYITSALLSMESAADHGVAVVILDRPNPVSGVMVQGPVLDTAWTSFVGMLPVAMRHGMTFGELANFGREFLELGTDLTVVPADGWTREVWFDETGLPWIRPSPNMPDLESATHYSGLVVFEGTNLSVGRGTPVAFRVLAAPWLDPAQVIGAVGTAEGVSLTDTTIAPVEPTDGKYPGLVLPAVKLTVTDRRVYNPPRVGFLLLSAIARLHRDSLTWKEDYTTRRWGRGGDIAAVLQGASADSIWEGIELELQDFVRRRARFLIYP